MATRPRSHTVRRRINPKGIIIDPEIVNDEEARRYWILQGYRVPKPGPVVIEDDRPLVRVSPQ